MKQNNVCELPYVRRKVTFGATGSHRVREQQAGEIAPTYQAASRESRLLPRTQISGTAASSIARTEGSTRLSSCKAIGQTRNGRGQAMDDLRTLSLPHVQLNNA